MACLASIPLELLVLISSHLSTPDLGALRCTCKHVEKSLYDSFAREFFFKKQFMLTQPSLQALVDISKHASLSKRLEHVIIALDQYCFNGDQRVLLEESSLQYAQGCADQITLLNSGIDREMLTEAFRNLPNLSTVGIRDFNSASRLRDGNIPWTSYGSTTIYRETGVRLERADNHRSNYHSTRFESRVFTTILYALGKAHRTPPTLEILLRQRNSGLRDEAFNVPDFFLPIVEPVLRGLNTLLLSLNFDSTLFGVYDPSVFEGSCRLARGFLSQTSELAHLRLNFQKDRLNANEMFLVWLSSPTGNCNPLLPSSIQPSSDYIFSEAPIALHHLQRLDLGVVSLKPDLLLAVLNKFAPSLGSVSLWRVELFPSENVLIEPPYDQSMNLWSGFFRALATLPQLKLNYLLVGAVSLRKKKREVVPYLVTFNLPDDTVSTFSSADKKSIEYSGKNMQDTLRRLATYVQVCWPAVVEGDSEGNSEDDDDD